jgi:hypothetical protein
MQIRFHLDESVRRAVAEGLRKRGIDATTASDAGLLGASDAEHVEFASRENRILVTHDDDFLRLHHDGREHTGIAYCHQQARSIGEIVLKLTWLWRTQTAEELRGTVQFL